MYLSITTKTELWFFSNRDKQYWKRSNLKKKSIFFLEIFSFVSRKLLFNVMEWEKNIDISFSSKSKLCNWERNNFYCCLNFVLGKNSDLLFNHWLNETPQPDVVIKINFSFQINFEKKKSKIFARTSVISILKIAYNYFFFFIFFEFRQTLIQNFWCKEVSTTN